MATKPVARTPAAKAKAAAKAAKPKAKLPVVSEEAARFLADILANPEDRKARLVYADLLQDAGDPRGEYIITQSARADCAAGDERIPELDARIAELEKKHKKTWRAACGENKGARYEYRRGFVEKLALDAKDLLANARKIFAAEPVEELNVWKIWELDAKPGKSRLAPLLALPLHRIKRLSLRTMLDAVDAEALAAATTLGAVEVLDLTNENAYKQQLAPLAKATSLPRLRELRLGCNIGDAVMAKLAASKTLRFTRLVAPNNDLGPAACAAIANATWAPQLEHLDLSGNIRMGDEGLRALAASPNFTALQSLRLDYVERSDAVAGILHAKFGARLLPPLGVAIG